MQISHGMCEHIDRYDGFARELCARGIAVCASDHLGHGKSVNGEDELGYFGGRGSASLLADDLELMRGVMRRRYRRLPYILFGHSLGSFVVRDYLARYGENLDGAILCGTSGTNKRINAGIAVSSAICALRGRKHRSTALLKAAFRGYNDGFPGEEGELAWMTRDPAVIAGYKADPLCGYCFTAGGFNEMFRLLKSISGEQWAAKVPQSLPVLIISGGDDPVGARGAGPEEVYRLLRDSELSDVQLKLYDGMRHEILTDPEREGPINDIAEWTLGVAEGAAEASMLP